MDSSNELRTKLAICVAVFIALIAWSIYWPYTAAVDSILHYFNAREAVFNPKSALSPWARPVYKLFLVFPAMHGLKSARAAQALVTVILMWQTAALAKDLRIARAWLAMPMLIWQPVVFALASDTLSELPFALFFTIILRLWHRRRWTIAALIAGFTPMVRPEGFLLALLAVVLCLGAKNFVGALIAAVGLVFWCIACAIVAHNWHYFIDVWSWPAGGYVAYGRGSIFHHLLRWPWYCGWVLLPLFCFGLTPSLRDRSMRLAMIVWLTIPLVHSVLFFSGWFASIGDMRILATTSPITALICLRGWNAMQNWLARKSYSSKTQRAIGLTAAILASCWVCFEYTHHIAHYCCFGALDCATYIREHRLVETAPKLFAGDRYVLEVLDFPIDQKPLLEDAPFDGGVLKDLAALPAGTIGVWDNLGSGHRYGTSIDQVVSAGYEILYESKQLVSDRPENLFGFGWKKELRYVVVRKKAPSL